MANVPAGGGVVAPARGARGVSVSKVNPLLWRSDLSSPDERHRAFGGSGPRNVEVCTASLKGEGYTRLR